MPPPNPWSASLVSQYEPKTPKSPAWLGTAQSAESAQARKKRFMGKTSIVLAAKHLCGRRLREGARHVPLHYAPFTPTIFGACRTPFRLHVPSVPAALTSL